MSIIKNYIEQSKEFNWDVNIPEPIHMKRITDKYKNSNKGELQVLLDDDYLVYLIVLNTHDDDFYELDKAMTKYGCTIAIYWSEKDNKWRHL